MAGWGERPLLIASGDAVLGRVHVPERLIRLDDLMYEHRPIPDLMNDVYDRMVAASSVQTTNACRPVFLPRPEGHRRAHPEEKAIADAISELGVISIRGWQMSARQQVAAVSSASALIGFSGSNLHNSLFAQRGTAVIEILDERATAHFGTERRDLQQPLCDLREQPLFPVPSFSNGTPLSSAAVVSAVASALRGRQGRL